MGAVLECLTAACKALRLREFRGQAPKLGFVGLYPQNHLNLLIEIIKFIKAINR